MYCTAVFRGELPSLFVEAVCSSYTRAPFVPSPAYSSGESSSCQDLIELLYVYYMK